MIRLGLLRSWLAIPLAMIVVLQTMNVVPVSDRGLRCWFGHFGPTTLGPGMHWTLPRPFGSIETMPVGRMLELPFGESTQVAREPSGLRAYELPLVIDGGAESIVIQGSVRVALPPERDSMVRHVTRVRDPLPLVQHLVRRVVTQQTLAHSLDRLMEAEASSLAETIHAQLTAQCNRLQLGIAIVSVEIHGLQPPEEVNGAFAEVINAKIDAARQVAEAQGFAAMELHRRKMMSDTAVADAHIVAKKRMTQVRDECVRFQSLTTSVVGDRSLIKHLLNVETLATALERKPLILVDATLPDQTGVSFFEKGFGEPRP